MVFLGVGGSETSVGFYSFSVSCSIIKSAVQSLVNQMYLIKDEAE